MAGAAFISSCRCGQVFDDALSLEMHQVRGFSTRCGRKKAFIKSASPPQLNTDTSQPWMATEKLFSKRGEQPRFATPILSQAPLVDDDSTDVLRGTTSPGNLDAYEDEPPPASPASPPSPVFRKRALPEENNIFRDQAEEETAIASAEKTLSIDDATPKEMLQAFTRLMDIVADRSGIATTDRVMQLVLHPNWSLQKVASLIRDAKLSTVNKIREKMKAETEEEMRAEGFAETEIQNPDDPQLYTTVWLRDSVSVLKKQLQRAVVHGANKNFHISPFHAKNSRGIGCVSHPMSAHVAHSSIPLVKECVMQVANEKRTGEMLVSWNDHGSEDVAQSFVGLLQAYSDGSNMTISTNSLSFYPFQMTFLNFEQRTKDQIVAEGDAVVAYLSTDKTWRRRVDKALEVQRGFDGDDDLAKARNGLSNLVLGIDSDNHPKTSTATELKGCFEVAAKCSTYALDPESDEDGPSGYAGADEEDSDNEDAEMFTGQDYLKRNLDEEIEGQRIFAAMFRICAAPVKNIATSGLLFRCSDGKLYKAHLPLASYVADSPEINHVACVKKGYCHRCFCKPADLNGENGLADVAPARDIRVTKCINGEYDKARKNHDKKARTAAMEKFTAYQIHPMLPVIADWPFSHLPGLGPYEIFRFDHMHSHPLGLCKHLLLALHRRANDEETKTNNRTDFNKENGVFTWKRGAERKIARRNKVVLNALNWLLVSIDRDSPQSGVKVDFTRGKKVGRLNSVFTEKGIITMLEAKDYKNLTEVLPFLAALADRLINRLHEKDGPNWNNVEPLLTDLFVAYTEMDAAQTRRGRVDKSYSKAELIDIQAKKKRFAKLAVSEKIAKYQTSTWNIEKFHKSDKHALADIIALGFYAYYDSSVFESSHIVFKRLFRATSQRHSSGMREATAKLARKDCINMRVNQLCPRDALVHAMVYGQPKEQKIYSVAKNLARKKDAAVLTSYGNVFTLFTLQKMMDNVDIGTKNWRTFMSVTGTKRVSLETKRGIDFATTNDFVRACGGPNFLAKPVSDILSRLSSLPYDHKGDQPDVSPVTSELYDVRGYTENDVQFKVVQSAYVPSINVPTLRDVVKSSHKSCVISFLDDGDRHLTRVISTNSWSHAGKRRKDTVFLEGGHSALSGSRTLWAAKVLAFIRCDAPHGFFANPDNQQRAVVRYYEILNPRSLHKVDNSLGCVKLRWAFLPNGDPWVDVVSVDAIRGTFQAIPDGFHVLSEPENEAQEENAETWKDRRFYVNRFRTLPLDESYYLNDR